MANPYSQYTGARVQPVPAGFIQAYGNVGKLYAQGLAGLGEGIGEGIAKYYENKEERATLSGKGEGFVEAAQAYPDLYGSLLTPATLKKLQEMPDMGLNSLRQFIGKLDAQKTLLEKGETFQLKRDTLESDKAEAKKTAARAEKTFGLAKDKFAHQKTEDEKAEAQLAKTNKLAMARYNLSVSGYALTKQERDDKVAREIKADTQRADDHQAALEAKGMAKKHKLVIAGRYLPGEDITVSPDDPRGLDPFSVPQFAAIGREYYPAVEEDDVPINLAQAMGKASTATLANKLWDDYQAEQREAGELERDKKKTRALREIPAAADLQLTGLVNEFKKATTDQEKQRLGGRAALLLMFHVKGLEKPLTPEDGIKYLQESIFPPVAVGLPGPPTETAEERKTRLQFQHGIIRLDDLIQEADDNDFTGVFPQLKSQLLDVILPALTIDKFADEERMTFRHRASILSQNLLRALNEEGRLSETDAIRILPLTPLPNDDNPMFKAKLKGIRELLFAKLKLQDAQAGRADVFSLEPEVFFEKLGQPDDKFGGSIVIPNGLAPSVIRLMPQFKFIGGDRNKPVTAQYIKKLLGEKKIDAKGAKLWIKHAEIPLPPTN